MHHYPNPLRRAREENEQPRRQRKPPHQRGSVYTVLYDPETRASLLGTKNQRANWWSGDPRGGYITNNPGLEVYPGGGFFHEGTLPEHSFHNPEHFIDAAAREFREETGHTISPFYRRIEPPVDFVRNGAPLEPILFHGAATIWRHPQNTHGALYVPVRENHLHDIANSFGDIVAADRASHQLRRPTHRADDELRSLAVRDYAHATNAFNPERPYQAPYYPFTNQQMRANMSVDWFADILRNMPGGPPPE